jgi:hypothetical protein
MRIKNFLKEHGISLGLGVGIGVGMGLVTAAATIGIAAAAGMGLTLGTATALLLTTFGISALAGPFFATTVIGGMILGAIAKPIEQAAHMKFKPATSFVSMLIAQGLIIASLLAAGIIADKPNEDDPSAPGSTEATSAVVIPESEAENGLANIVIEMEKSKPSLNTPFNKIVMAPSSMVDGTNDTPPTPSYTPPAP